jgi:hypothetical protein
MILQRVLEESCRVKNVAFGSGFAIIACSHIKDARLSLKFIAAVRAWIALSFVMFVPSCGRKPWFASVFIIGQGPRTVCLLLVIVIDFGEERRREEKRRGNTVIWSSG